MIITRHTDGKFTIKATEKDIKLLEICVQGNIVLANINKQDRESNAYKDAYKLLIGLKHALAKRTNTKDAQN